MIGPLAYIGGKRRIAKYLSSLIPPHTTYVEPFAGGAQVFFYKPRSRVEVLNDLDDEIVNFLVVTQRHPHELVRLLRWQPVSRRLFQWHGDQPPDLLTDIERAARFFYLQKNTWGGKRTGRNFHFGVMKIAGHLPALLPKRLQEAAIRLADVQLERAPYQDVLTRYDRATTLFYCDPPYVGVSFYRHNFTDAQFAELAERLAAIRGKFLLSINDCEKTRGWFGRFHSQKVSLTYTATHQPRRFTERIYANFPLPPPPSTLTPAE